VHAPPRTLRRLRRARPDAVVLAERPSPWRALARALRPHQWAKNLLLLMPALAAHRPPSAALLATCVLGILAFSAVASAIYVLNDLADLPHDRAHPRKRSRPLASGDLPLAWGVGAVPVLLAIGLAATLSLPPAFGAVVGIYAAASVAYSFDLKRRLLLDVLVLSLLYTLRVVAGAALTGVELSRWFIAFSIFLFFALAAVKRVVELGATVAADSVPLAGRAYRRVDRHTLLALGAAATMTSCLVLCLYITSDEVLQLYGRPDWLWPLLPLLLYWQARLWMFAMRGSLHDDPIVFALGDRVSHLVMVGGLALVWLAR
jgi:4-hydroxybenzoate polyprenyltransferase